MQKTNDNSICITIKELALNLRIGLLPQERAAPQRVLVWMDLYVAPDYLDGVDERSIVDYGAVCASLQAWEARDHVDLIETLVQDGFEIAFAYQSVQSARIAIMKPDIISEALAVGVEVFQRRP